MPTDIATLVFLTVFFLGYFAVNGYLAWRVRVLWARRVPRWIFVLAAALLTCAYPCARLFFPDEGFSALESAASYWMGFAMFLFCWFFAAEIVWAVARRFGARARVRNVLFGCAAAAALLTAVYGRWHMENIAVAHYDVRVDKPADGRTHLRVVVMSDLHLGKGMPAAWLDKVVALVNAQNPDIVVIPGDLVDSSAAAFERDGYAAAFRRLRAPLGVYAVRGNHDFFEKDRARLQAAFESAGIVLLDDRALEVGGLTIAGHMDKSVCKRALLSEVLCGVDKAKPLLLLDHRPEDLRESIENGVDVQFSGHTHGGQFFPSTLVTRLCYVCDHGLWTYGTFHLVVSSGAGLWGPKYRVGSQSEIAVVDIAFAAQR